VPGWTNLLRGYQAVEARATADINDTGARL
jgi:hypothetical protein